MAIADPTIRASRFAPRLEVATLAQAIVRDGEGATKFITVRSRVDAMSRNAGESHSPSPHPPSRRRFRVGSESRRIVCAIGNAAVADSTRRACPSGSTRCS
jgi:hypothetical protein